MERPIRCYLEVLSPVHLGCDEVYDPLSFILEENNQRLIVFDPWEFYTQMSSADRQRFSAICREGTVGSLQKLYRFFKGRSATGREVKVCPGLVDHYRKTLDLSPEIFQKEPVNEKKKLSKFQARGPYQILEVIEPGSVFVGELAVLERPPGAQIRKPLQTADLWSAAVFYRREKAREDEDLTGIDLHFPETPPVTRGPLLRLGRHSGAECVTIEGHRQIKIMQGKGQPPKTEKEATTLWLAADHPKPQPNQRRDLKPFGWVVAGELTADLENQYTDLEAAWRRAQCSAGNDSPKTPEGGAKALPVSPKPVSPPALEVWEKAQLTWTPGNQTLTANWEGKKAIVRGKDLVPAPLHQRLFVKKKLVPARVTVEPLGNAWRIVKVETGA
jgi:hypothetical protein